jgi:hypothetical protein
MIAGLEQVQKQMELRLEQVKKTLEDLKAQRAQQNESKPQDKPSESYRKTSQDEDITMM